MNILNDIRWKMFWSASESTQTSVYKRVHRFLSATILAITTAVFMAFLKIY